jgi:uncharacterized protein YeaO (DUF488 family)
MTVVVKRVYEPAAAADGVRVLVDRLWPRGLTKEEAAVKFWLRDLAPSNELRQWFHANPESWALFRKRYLKELTGPKATAAVEKLHDLAEGKKTWRKERRTSPFCTHPATRSATTRRC